MPTAPVIVVDPGPLSRRRKLLAMLLGAFAVFVLAVNTTGDTKSALITLIPAVVGALVAYRVENTPDTPSAKFLVQVAAALVTLLVFLVQHGLEDWRSAGYVFLAAVLGAGATYWTPNAGQAFIDAVPAPPAA